MDLRRLRHGEWIAGISGAVLLVALFLDWYSADGGASANAWESFSVTDVVLMLAALMGIALAVSAPTQRSPAVPQTISALTVPVALVAAVLAVIHTLSLPDGRDGRESGLWHRHRGHARRARRRVAQHRRRELPARGAATGRGHAAAGAEAAQRAGRATNDVHAASAAATCSRWSPRSRCCS